MKNFYLYGFDFVHDRLIGVRGDDSPWLCTDLINTHFILGETG